MSIMKRHIESLEKFDPQVRIEGTYKLKPMQWKEGGDMPNRWDYFDRYVWEPLMLMWKKSEFIVLDKNFCIQSMNRVIECVTSDRMPHWLRPFNRGNNWKLAVKERNLVHIVLACLGISSSQSNRLLSENFQHVENNIAHSNFEWLFAVIWNCQFRKKMFTSTDEESATNYFLSEVELCRRGEDSQDGRLLAEEDRER